MTDQEQALSREPANEQLPCLGCEEPTSNGGWCWCREVLCWTCHDRGAHHWTGPWVFPKEDRIA